MRTKNTTRILSIVLCLILVFPMALAAEEKTDYEGHYGEESIRKLFEKGVITGYEDGSFKPDREISRAEFMTIINRAFDFKEQAEISFSDVKEGQWHYEQIARAVKAGYIKGFTDGTMRPTANITRQEAAVIIARILDIEKDGDIKKLATLKDEDKVPQWSAQGVAAIVERGYIDLKEDNQFLATQNLTRADMAIAIVRSQEEVIAKLYDKPGTYIGGKINGNVKIENKGITLTNAEINGDLILGEGIGDGDIRLTKVTVKGNTIVKGGGKNTITLENCQFEKIIILKEDGKIRILAKSNTKINQSEVKSGAILESQGKAGEGFGYITIAEDISEDSIVELIGDFKTIEIKGNGVDIQASGGTIENLTVAKGTKDIKLDLAKDTKITELTTDSAAIITGTGKIDKATVNVQGVKIEAPVTKLETAPDIKVDIPKKETTPAAGGGGGGSGGGGGGSKGGGTSTPAKTEVGTISIGGEIVVGATLTAKASGQPNLEATYKWMRADTKGGIYTYIPSATSETYKLTDDDFDNYIKVEVKGTGKYTGTKESGIIGAIKKLDSISIKKQPTGLEYIEGQKLDLSGLEVTLKYSDAISEDVPVANFSSKNVTTDPVNGSVLGVGLNEKPVSVSAYGKTVNTSNLTVEAKAVDSIAVNKQPTKLNYVEGQNLDLKGLVVTLNYNDDDKKDIVLDDFAENNITASPDNGALLGIDIHHGKPIVVSRDGKTVDTNNLTVVAKEVNGITIKTQPTKLSYVEGQNLDITGLSVTLTYNDGTSEDVVLDKLEEKGVTINPIDGMVLDITEHNGKPIVVSCNGKEANTNNLKIVAKVVDSITVKNQPDKLNYVVGKELNLTGLEVSLKYNDESIEDVEYKDFTEKGLSTAPVDGYELEFNDNGTKIKIIHTDSGKFVETNKLTVVKEIFNITVPEIIGGTVIVDAHENRAPAGEVIKVTVSLSPDVGKELLGIAVKDGDRDISGDVKLDENPNKIGEEFTFFMPNNDVSVSVTVGEPKKLDIALGVTSQTPLINGILEKFSDLTWSYFTNTLTLNNYEGNHLGVPSSETYRLDLELKGANKITNNIHVTPGLKFKDQVTIKGDGTLKISNSFNSDTTVVNGIGFSSYIHNLKFQDGATIDVTVEAKGSKGVAISNIMPFIGNEVAAYKGTATLGGDDGDSAEKPIKITYHVAKGTELKGENIYIGNIEVTDLRSGGFDGTTINDVDTIDFYENQTIVFAKHNEKYYKIIIKEDTPIADFQNTKVTDTTASFTWTKAIDATDVKIQQSLQGENNWKDAITQAALTPESTSATVTGLTPFTDYAFKLVVTGGENQGDTEVIEVKTLEETDDQKAVNAEADKYETTAEIAKDVEVGADVTSTVVKLLEGETADGSIELSYAISSGGTYLEIIDGVIKLKDQKISEGDAKETVTITFKKGVASTTKEVEVTIESSNKKLIKINGEKKELTEELPKGLSWDDDTKTLTMNGYTGGAIYTNFEAGYNLAKLKIDGTNTITVNDITSTAPVIALGTKTTLDITGTGTLTINVTTADSSNTIGMYSGGYNGANNIGGASKSNISIGDSATINIKALSNSTNGNRHSSAIMAGTLTLNGGTLGISSESIKGIAYGFEGPYFVCKKGIFKINDEISIPLDNTRYSVLSMETPYVDGAKATKITNLTWDSTNDGTEEDEAVEYTIHLKSDTAELTVNDIAVVLNKSMTLEVFSDGNFNTEWQGIVFNEGKTQDTVYVKAKRTADGKTTIRYFIINLIKE